jgi:myo-inositol-1(or 4)-monophosphatase
LASEDDRSAVLELDWLAFCHRARHGVLAAVDALSGVAERGRATGRGEGGDMAIAVDRAAEDAIFAELERLGVGVLAISEERGEVEVGGGGPVRVVIDPVDGSLNAKRELPFYGVSIAVASGPSMREVEFGYVTALPSGEEWWASRGGGAYADGRRLEPLTGGRLEILGVESADPGIVALAAEALGATEAHRLRMIGSIALTLCYVASGRMDGMLSLRVCRSVDAAAGQLIVREAGGVVAFPDAGRDGLDVPLALGMRSRVLAGASDAIFEIVNAAAAKVGASGRG